MLVMDKCSRLAVGLHAGAATACKQEIKYAVKTLLGKKMGRDIKTLLLHFTRKTCTDNTAKIQPNVQYFVSPASSCFIRRLCDSGLTIASRETPPPPPPTPYHTPVYFNDTAYFHSAFLKDTPIPFFLLHFRQSPCWPVNGRDQLCVC